MHATTSTLAPLGSLPRVEKPGRHGGRIGPRSVPSAGSVLTRVRVLVLAFAILAGGFAALAPHAAPEASAAGGCRVSAMVHYSNGYVAGTGGSNCGYNVSQTVKVTLYGNGTWLASRTVSSYTSVLAVITPWARGYCGVRYQTAMTHYVGGYYTTTWSPGFYLC